MRKFCRFILGVVLGMFVSVQTGRATDIPIFPTGPVFTLNNLAWGTSTQPGFNNTFLFTPLSLNESVCVFIQNNNPTNAHAVFASLQLTPNPSEQTPADNTWLTFATFTSAGVTVAASPSTPIELGGYASSAANVAIKFSGTSSQAGSPDTATVFIIQTQGDCFFGTSGANVANKLNAASTATEFQAASEGLGQGFAVSDTETNPAAGTIMTHVWINGTTRQEYPDHVILSSSVAVEITVNYTSTAGSGCSANSGFNVKNAAASFATSDFHCTGAPTVAGKLADIQLAAGQSFVVDLKGVVGSLSLSGIDVIVVGTVTGTVSSSFYWSER